MNRRWTTIVIAGAVSAWPLAAAASSAPAGLPLPDDLQFLDNATIDEVVALSEGGRPECAALTGILALSFVSAFASMADETTEPLDDEMAPVSAVADSLEEVDDLDDLDDLDLGVEAFYALFAPVIVPLLSRSAPPADPDVAGTITFFGDQLIAAIYELRELGFSDDDLLEIQALTTQSWSSPAVTFESPDATEAPDETLGVSPDLAAKVEELLPGHDFESIDLAAGPTDSISPDAGLPWADQCPETVAFLDFSMDVDVSVAFSVTVPG